MILLITPFIGIISIQPASAAETVLTPKWTRTGLGTNWEGGLVIGDVTGDGQEDIVWGGNDNLVVLNGNTGATVATYAQQRIGQYCQPQLYDIDNDGILEILVPLYYQPGLAAVKYDGDNTLRQLWITNTEGTTGSGSVMAKPVAGDIDGDGKIDIFIGSQDVSPGGYYNDPDTQTGYHYPDGYDGTVCRIDATNGNIIAQTFTWRPCSGGLSLADTDNDGVFELYQGDRGIYYGDGNYGAGERSWWAENLTIRWNRLDALTSSQAPALVDVNGDGILDVITGMYSEMSILNSTNGQWINHLTSTGQELAPRGVMSVHYGVTVYDIDGDGHQELLTNDGDHDDNNATDIYDLVTGQLKAQLPLGNFNSTQPYDNKWAPLVADIYSNGNNADGSPRLEIITGANTTRPPGTTNTACLLIYDNSYNLLQNVTNSLSGQISYPTVQDIDRDGLLELVCGSSIGRVYAYDTSAPAPGYNQAALPGSQRIRSEVTYFGEKRTGAAVYQPAPWAPNYWTTPLVAANYPGTDALKIPQSTTSLSFKLRDHQSIPLTYTVTTSPDIGSTSGSSSGNPYNWGTYTLNFNKPLAYDTTYKYTVTASDGTHSTQRTYNFRTQLAPNTGNSAPTQGNPSLIAQDGLGTTSSTFIATNQSTTDPNVGDKVTNTYLWSINGQQIANLVLPFNTQNEITTKDYSAYSNDGTVIGATWTANGKVGGAYIFDGQNDAIIISDGGAGYYDNKTYSNYNPELGGDGTWTAMSAEAWINLSAYNNGSRIIAKYPSYEIGFESNFNAGQSNRLVASVWPHTGAVSTDDNHASTDRAQTTTANVNLQLNTWYHIAFTYESGVGIKLYLNGVQVAQRTGVTGVLENSLGAPVTIGRLVQPFAGIIDEVQIYPYALSATNINNYYLATKDGLSTSSTFNPSGMVAPGNTLTCTIIPSDSYVDGTSRSTTVTLQNTAPTASGLQISPIRVGNTRLSTETLSAYYTYLDVEGQPESGSQISWYMNGGLQSGLNDQKNVPSATTQIGQTWYFTVTPRDSDGALGTTQTSPTVTIRGNTAPTTTTPILDSANGGAAYSDEDLTTTAGTTTDQDNDATTNIFHWTQNGISQTNLQMPFDTELPTVPNTNGFVKDYSGYNNNGAANGSTWVDDGIIGGALNFNGDDYITVQENGNSLGGDGSWSQISLEFWAQASGATSTQTVVLKPDSTYGPGINSFGVGYRAQYRSYTNGYRIYWIIGSGTTLTSLNVQINEGPGEWHHVVCTYQSGVGLKIYTDGVLRATLAATGNINATPGGQLYIGGVNSGSGDFVGQMDEVRIYPTALSPSQVFQRYSDTSDGISESETIVPQETATNDNWQCQIIPNDSWGDGAGINSQTISIASRNTQPHIDWYSPANKIISSTVGSSLSFQQYSSDPNGDYLSYTWTLDDIQQATTQNFTLTTPAGSHKIEVTVSDGSLSDSQTWTVNVPSNTNYDLTISSSSNGATNPTADLYQYAEGTSISIQAIPDTGYKLDHWILDGANAGDANPYLVTMFSNHEITAIFTQIPESTYYQLSISNSGSGSTQPTGTNSYLEGSTLSVTATAALNWEFNHWTLDGNNVGSTNPLTLTINDNHNLVAVFTENPQYQLNIESQGSGNTNPVGTNMYYEGSIVQVTAIADANSKLDHWLLNGNDVGGSNPYTITINADNQLVAVFVPMAINPPVFADGFESSSFSVWSSTTRTTNEITTVLTSPVHSGNYAALFTSNGDGGYERAYASRSGLSIDEFYTQAYVYVGQNGIVDNGDRFYFMQMMAGGNILAYGGWRQDSSGNLHWHLMIRDGTNTVGVYSTNVPTTGVWYLVELHWKADATSGLGELYVNGELVASITDRNTANYGSATTARIGLPEIYNCEATNLYVDDVTISTQTSDTPLQYLLSVNTVGSGSVTMNPNQANYASGSVVQLTALPVAGWTFNSWSGDISGTDTTILVTMDGNKDITAIFTENSLPQQYSLSVNIVGQGIVTVNPQLALYDSGSQVTLTAVPANGWIFAGWSGDLTGNTNPTSITIDSDKTLTATFTQTPQGTIFADGFESGTFDAWTSTSTGSSGSGETLSITTNPVYSGTYAATFSSNGGGSYEKAYLSKTLNPTLSTIDLQGTFSLTQNGIIDSSDRIKLIELRAGSTIIAAAGIIQRSGSFSWWVETRDGTSYVETYSTQAMGDLSTWFTIELQWVNDPSNGGATLWVNGSPVIQVSGDNTSNYGNASQIRIGLAEVYNCSATTVIQDNVTIDNKKIDP